MIERFLVAWCRQMHNRPMWPVQGKYICSQCLRQHPVPWEARTPVVMPTRATQPVASSSASMDVCA